MRELNPEALMCRNGDKIVQPKWMLERLEKDREKWRLANEKEEIKKKSEEK
jgi:hypothetical protein